MKIYEGTISPPDDGYIAIVVAKFNRSITQGLLDGALAKLEQHAVRALDIRVCWVPGAFELPAVAQRFVEDSECQAVICLGAVIKGETQHDYFINQAISTEICRIGVLSGKPVIFGVLTCNTVEQAVARSSMQEQSRDKSVDPTAGNKGAEAAETALEMIQLYTELPSPNLSVPY
jgi:6,7-dimethyl-8-ribityllumazine synthase